MERAPTPEEFARLLQEISAAPTYNDANDVLMTLSLQGVILDDDQYCVVHDLMDEKPARD